MRSFVLSPVVHIKERFFCCVFLPIWTFSLLGGWWSYSASTAVKKNQYLPHLMNRILYKSGYE